MRVDSISQSLKLNPSWETDINLTKIVTNICVYDLPFTNQLSRYLFQQVEEYKEAEDLAKKNHLGVWEYGDITDDDAREFGR